MSNKDQELFMQNIADRLGRKRSESAPKHPYRGAPDFWKQHNLSTDERTELFMDNWRKAGGQAERFKDKESLKSFIVETAAEMSVRHVIRNNQEEINELNLAASLPDVEVTVWGEHDSEALKVKAAGADLGIVEADYAVSVTGSVVVQSNEHKGRSVSLLPTALIILIPIDKIKTRMGEVMEELNHIQSDKMPAGIHFISGPSRSADIENDLTIGVHGPGVVYALIIG
jgi:L-lactate dehydrogenase complex protein LldG